MSEIELKSSTMGTEKFLNIQYCQIAEIELKLSTLIGEIFKH